MSWTMISAGLVGVFLAISNLGSLEAGESRLTLHYGYAYKVKCEGRLLASVVGDEKVISREALPREIGCGLYLVPQLKAGETNLFLETSTGTIQRAIEISNSPTDGPFELLLRGSP